MSRVSCSGFDEPQDRVWRPFRINSSGRGINLMLISFYSHLLMAQLRRHGRCRARLLEQAVLRICPARLPAICDCARRVQTEPARVVAGGRIDLPPILWTVQ